MEMGAPERDLLRIAAIVHRELVKVVVLIGVTVIAFLLTRSLALANRETNERDAQEWYRRGRLASDSGRNDEAVQALRRAVVRRRGDRAYVLALAAALAGRGETVAARRELLSLRDAAPEDADVNLALARLEARQGHDAEAQRFYYNALYAPWPTDRSDARRHVRMELIRLLAKAGERSRALSELVAASIDVPPNARRQDEVAQLFADVGDDRRALDHFQQALRSAADDSTAIHGAGMAAFRLGDYRLAREYLRGAANSDDVSDTRQLVELVLGNDPLAPRLGVAERRRRLAQSLEHVQARLAACAAVPQSVDAGGMQKELAAYSQRVRSRASIDQDSVEDALGAISRVEASLNGRCGDADPLDRALVLIARRHGTGVQ